MLILPPEKESKFGSKEPQNRQKLNPLAVSERQKMCTACEGRIPLDALVCPYCATEQVLMQTTNHKSLQDSLTAPYNPSYKSQAPFAPKEKKFAPPPSHMGLPKVQPQALPEEKEESKSSFTPILLLSIGANLLVLGLLQLFFSENGVLRLEWDSSHWFFYCLAALPLLLFGWRKASQ